MDSSTQKKTFTSDFRPMVRSLLFIGLAFFYLDFMIPILSNTVFNAQGTELGIVFSLQTIGYMLSSPLAGYLSDRWSKKKLILIGTIGRGIAYFVIYFSIFFRSYYVLISGAFVLGFMVSFFITPIALLFIH